jgi:hypothetical protein
MVTVDPKTGQMTFEVNGVVGTKCEEVTAALERNNDVVQKQYTEEHEVPDVLPDYVTAPDVEE